MKKKKQLLIDTALSLFYKQGINSIGINEVLNVSGVAKRTLYNHFESKEALIIAALEQRHQIFMEWLEEKLSSAQTCAEVIDQLFTALNGWFHGSEEKLGEFRGCFSSIRPRNSVTTAARSQRIAATISSKSES